jgi:hypothetical protein
MGVYFVWLDYSDKGYGKTPIDAELSFRIVSKTGVEGEEVVISVKSP